MRSLLAAALLAVATLSCSEGDPVEVAEDPVVDSPSVRPLPEPRFRTRTRGRLDVGEGVVDERSPAEVIAGMPVVEIVVQVVEPGVPAGDGLEREGRELVYIVGPKRTREVGDLYEFLAQMFEDSRGRSARIRAREGVFPMEAIDALEAAASAGLGSIEIVGLPEPGEADGAPREAASAELDRE